MPRSTIWVIWVCAQQSLSMKELSVIGAGEKMSDISFLMPDFPEMTEFTPVSTIVQSY